VLVSPLTGRSAGSDESSFVLVEWTDEGGTTSREWPIAPFHVHDADDPTDFAAVFRKYESELF